MTLSAEPIGVEGRDRETGAKAEKSTLEASCSNPGERGWGLVQEISGECGKNS